MTRWLKWILVAVGLGVGASAVAQEVIVFTDFRALVVQSHRVEGTWTYLRLPSGEMAVPSSSILHIEVEQGVSAAPVASSPYVPPSPASQPMPPRPAPFRPEPAHPAWQRPSPPPPAEESDEEDEKSDDSMADEESDEPPAEIQPPAKMATPPVVVPGGLPFQQKLPQPVEPKD